ncbi:universal stress protein [bacterium]|nr:universal stress protein [bacterium]
MKILIPTDFSDNARVAIDYVFSHFKGSQNQVKLVHTVKAPASTSGVLIRIDDLMRKDADEAMQRELEYISETYKAEPETSIRFGYLKDWVNNEIEAWHANLIVMGTKGETNVASKLMGSVTEGMIRHSKVPVLAIPYGEFDSINNVVIATDDLNVEKNEQVLKYLKDMELIRPSLTSLFVDTKGDAKAPKNQPFGGYQINVHIERNKSVVEGINSYIDNNVVDLLVLFHHHNSMFDYLFNRSITKSICSNTQVPILVIPVRS